MSVTIAQLEGWLCQFPKDAEVGIDEGGLTLVVPEVNAYYELGGIEDEEES